MASIVGKKRGGATYYYLVESARVGGKPRIVSQEYLGTAEELAAAMRGGGLGLPDRVQHKDFGAVAAAWGLLEDLGVAAIIDEAAGARRSDAGASAGTYLALAALNRLADPCSKRGFADWWARTAAPRFTKIPASVLDHRRFWDAMHGVPLEALEEISRRIAVRIAGEFGLDCSSVALDMTNFATFIDTGNQKAPIAQRGKAKQKRSDLRLVGLGLVVTRDGGIPLAWRAYPGDRPDVTQFPALIGQLRASHQAICAAAGQRAALEEEIFGKHVLITSHDDWPASQVIAGYRSQSEAESSFRQLKDPHAVSFSPMHHWTEHNIRVHVFTCVLALQIAHLMRLKARRAGLDLSVRELLGELAGIGETVLLYQAGRGRPRAHRMLTDTTPVQDKLTEIFGLARYAPRR
jgi:transposase